MAVPLTSLSDRLRLWLFSVRTIQRANIVMTSPCPRSPNMTANRKGNVMTVYGAANEKRNIITNQGSGGELPLHQQLWTSDIWSGCGVCGSPPGLASR